MHTQNARKGQIELPGIVAHTECQIMGNIVHRYLQTKFEEKWVLKNIICHDHENDLYKSHATRGLSLKLFQKNNIAFVQTREEEVLFYLQYYKGKRFFDVVFSFKLVQAHINRPLI